MFKRSVKTSVLIVSAIVLGVLLALPLIAQAPGWSCRIHLPPNPYSFHKEDLEKLMWIDIANGEKESVPVYLHGEIKRDGKLVARANSNRIEIPPGGKKITRGDITKLTDEWWDPELEKTLIRAPILPEGKYEACVYVYKWGGKELLTKCCISFESKPVSPPRLIAPKDGATLKEKYPLFQWTPPTPTFPGVTYTLRIVEVPKGMPESISEEELQLCPTTHEEKDIRRTSFTYPLSARKLEKGKRYAWQVVAMVGGEVISASQVRTFTFSMFGIEAEIVSIECVSVGTYSFEVVITNPTDNEEIAEGNIENVSTPSPNNATITSTTPTLPVNISPGESQPITGEITTTDDQGNPTEVDEICFVFSLTGTQDPNNYAQTSVCDTTKPCPCQCGDWGEVEVLWTNTSGNAQSWTGNCGDPLDGYIEPFPETPIEVNTSITCEPPSCTPTYEWEIYHLPQGIIATGTTLPVSFTPTATGENVFTVRIRAFCDGTPCPPCTLEVPVKRQCQCGDWEGPGGTPMMHGDVQVTRAYLGEPGPPPGYFDCGDTVNMVAPGGITLNSVITCEPEGCEPTYTYDVIGPDGNLIEDDAEGHVVQLGYDPQNLGVYTVVFNASCDGTTCPPCTVFVEFECPDSLIIPSLVANTEICDGSGQTAVEVTNPPGQWTDELETDYGAKWLWDNPSGTADPPSGESHEFCTTFEIPAECEVESAKLLISADDKAPNIWLNGNYIGSHIGYDVVSSYNINPSYFVNGQNTLKVKVKDDAFKHYDDRAGGTWCLIIYFQ